MSPSINSVAAATATTQESPQIPDQLLPQVLDYLNGFVNTSIDFSKPNLNPYFAHVYLLFVGIYGLLIILSVLLNFGMVYHVYRRQLHDEPTCAFLVNVALANVLTVSIVLPITLAVLLVRNWIFGQTICLVLPLLQDIPIHVCMMTYLLIAVDRYRFLGNPRKPRIPAFVCALGTWFFAVCIVLPYLIYTTFLDLSHFGQPGLHMCLANLADDIQEYIRSLFIGTYVVPLAITTYLYVKSGQELENLENPMAIAVFGSRPRNPPPYSRTDSNASNDITLSFHSKRGSGSAGTAVFSTYSDDAEDSDLDALKERRTQNYLIMMVTSFGVCLGPLMILRLARPALEETYANSHHIDLTYVMIVWVAFLPTIITPSLYFSWQMSPSTAERLLSYLRLTHHQHSLVQEDTQASPIPRSRQPSTVAMRGSTSSAASSRRSGNGFTSLAAVPLAPRSPRYSPDPTGLRMSYSPYKSGLVL